MNTENTNGSDTMNNKIPESRNDRNARRSRQAFHTGLVLMGLTAGAVTLVPTDANAAYSGTIMRSVCMAGAMVPRNSDRDNWSNETNTTCMAKVIDTLSSTAHHWARVSIPVERKTSTTLITSTVQAQGGASGSGQVCAALWVSDALGNISGGSSACTSGVFGFEVLMPATLTLPVDGASLLDIAGQRNGEAHVVALTWTASGT